MKSFNYFPAILAGASVAFIFFGLTFSGSIEDKFVHLVAGSALISVLISFYYKKYKQIIAYGFSQLWPVPLFIIGIMQKGGDYFFLLKIFSSILASGILPGVIWLFINRKMTSNPNQ